MEKKKIGEDYSITSQKTINKYGSLPHLKMALNHSRKNSLYSESKPKIKLNTRNTSLARLNQKMSPVMNQQSPINRNVEIKDYQNVNIPKSPDSPIDDDILGENIDMKAIYKINPNPQYINSSPEKPALIDPALEDSDDF